MTPNAFTETAPDGWHPKSLLDALASLVEDRTTIVEIGSWLGHTAIAMATVCGKNAAGQVYCVDHWRGGSGTGAVDDPLTLYRRFLANVRMTSIEPRIVPIFDRSDHACELFKSHPIDLLFIDGDHRYEMVKADLANWAPFVRGGGIICGDDYIETGVKLAFNDYFGVQRVKTLALGRLAVVDVQEVA